MIARWAERAACKGVTDQSPWFPIEAYSPQGRGDDEVSETAAAYCRECPVISECLIYALENRVVGVWGGTSTHERDAMRKDLGITPAPVAPNRRGQRGVLDVVDEDPVWPSTPPEPVPAYLPASAF